MKKYDTTTRITNFNVDWMAIKSACMTTISKQAGKEPNKEWTRGDGKHHAAAFQGKGGCCERRCASDE